MTLTEMVDLWSRMTPKQRELVAIFGEAGWAAGSVEASVTVEEIEYQANKFGDDFKSGWNANGLPFKFRGS